MALSQTSVLKVYTTVIDDVIAGVRDAFLDDGVDEQVLQEMKQVWTTKLMSCKAIESAPDPQDQQPPAILAHSTKSVSHSKSNGTRKSKAAAATAAASASAASNQQENGKANVNNSIANNGKTAVPKAEPPSEPVLPSGPAAPNNAQQTVINQTHHQNSSANNAASNANVPSGVTGTGQQQPLPQQQPASAPAAVVAALDPNKLVAIQITLPAQPNVANSQPRVLTIQVPASALQENQLQQVLTSPIISSIMPLPPHIASTVLQQHVNSYLQNSGMNSIPIQKQLDGACDDDPMRVEEDVKANYTLVEKSKTADRFLLDQQLLNALMGGQRSTTPKGNEDIASTSTSTSGQSNVSRTTRRRPLRAGREPSKIVKKQAVAIEICTSMQLDGAVDTSDEEASDISDDNIADDDDEDLDKEEEDDLEAEGGAEEEPLNSEDDVTDEDASDLFDTDNVVVCQYDKITRSRNKWKFYLKDGIMHIGGKDYVFQKSNGDAEW